MKNDRKYTNNEDTDDYVFDDEPDDIFEGDIEEIDVNYEDDSTAASDNDIEDEYSEEIDEVTRRVANSRRHRLIFLITAAAAVVIAAVGIIVAVNTPSKIHVDMYEYFGIEHNSYDVRVLMNMEQTDAAAFVYNNTYYVANSYIAETLTDKFYYDEANSCVLYTTADHIYEIPVDSDTYSSEGESFKEDYTIAIYRDQLYMAIDFVADKAGFTYTEYNDPFRLSIVMDGVGMESVELSDKADVREDSSIKSDIIWNSKDIAVKWMAADSEDYKGWMKVVSEDGKYGYVKNKNASRTGAVIKSQSGYTAPEYTSIHKDYKINMVWHAVYSLTDNSKIESLLMDTSGITTVSPTWYQVVDATGAINSFADWDYISYIHDQGMEIWPLISDFTSVDENAGWDEKELLSNTESRRRLISNIVNEIITYGYDGINIDFEKVPKDAGPEYAQFIRELSVQCRKNKVVLSIDNYVPRTYNAQYNRAAQGECADYVIVMGYDEHYSGGGEAGSVASIDFVTDGMDQTLLEVPADKLINAIPFYTRLWYEDTDENGNVVLLSKSYSMQGGIDIAAELGLTVTWDDTVKQNVAHGKVDNMNYSIWLEDDDSMRARMQEVGARDIAGVAGWSLGMELDSVWDIINDNQ